MNNDDKILKILESIDKRLDQQGNDIADVKQSQAHTNTTLEALQEEVISSEERLTARIEEVRTEVQHSRAEAKVDNLHLQGKIDKVIKSHERRISNLEEKTETPNPDKN